MANLEDSNSTSSFDNSLVEIRASDNTAIGNVADSIKTNVTNSTGASAVNIQDGGNVISIDDAGGSITVDGAVTADQGTTPWVSNITQFGSSNVVTGTGNSGSGIPRVTVSNDSSITNISGTISLPTGASTSANQTNGSQKTQIVDGSGNIQPSGDANTRGIFIKPGDGTNTQSYTASGEAKVLVTPLTNSSVVKAQLQDNSGTAITLDQKVMTSSVPVVLSSDQTGINSFLDKTSSGSLTALNQAVTVVTNGMTTAIAQVTGTFNATANFEASIDGGSTYFSVSGIYLNTNLIPINALNSTGQVGFYVSGYTHFRVRIGTYTSGTVSVVINTGTGSLSNIATNIVRLSDNIGQYITSTTINSKQRLDINNASDGTSGNTVPFQTALVGGSDGTNLQSLSTDTSGRLKLAGSSYFHPTFTLRVQAVTGATGALATSLVIPISSTSSGNLIAVSVSSSVAGTVTVTDNLSQVYSTAISGTSGTHTSYIFYKANTSSGVTSITISSTSNSGMNAIVTEYFGISSSPLDKTSTGNVTGTSAFNSGTTATTTSAVELLLGTAHGVTKNNQTYTAGTGWSSVATSNGFNAGAGQIYMEDQYVGAVGSYAATGTASGNDTIIGNIATFIVTNTNLTAVNSPKTIKSGAGILRKVTVNTIGTGSPILTLYDNTTSSSSTVIATISLLNAIGYIDYNLNFTTGLTFTINSTTADFTLVYD